MAILAKQTQRVRRNISRKQAQQEIWDFLALSPSPPNSHEIADKLRIPLDLVLDVYDEIDELESIRSFDAAISSDDEVIPFEQAVAEIEQNRR